MHSDREWLWWGQNDPLWAVNSQPGKQRGASAPWTDEEFLASGRSYFRSVAAQWKHYGMGTSHVVEIGCGAGRITKQLLSVFARVTAVDVSPHQIELAKRLLGTDAERVRFSIPTSEGSLPVGPYDGMFSCEVFQHFTSFAGIERYCQATFEQLVPGGTICFQLPLRGIHQFNPVKYAWLRGVRTVRRALGGRRMMDYRMYPAPRVFNMLRSAGYVDCELRVFPAADHPAGHPYFFARKPSNP